MKKILEFVVVGALIGLGAQSVYSQDNRVREHKHMNIHADSCMVNKDSCNIYQHMHNNNMHNNTNYMMNNDKDVTPPKIKKQVSPGYPINAKNHGAEGLAYICAYVDEKGLVSKVHVMKSSGRYDLDSSAVESVKKYEFEPAMKDGRPIKMGVTIPVQYKLK